MRASIKMTSGTTSNNISKTRTLSVHRGKRASLIHRPIRKCSPMKIISQSRDQYSLKWWCAQDSWLSRWRWASRRWNESRRCYFVPLTVTSTTKIAIWWWNLRARCCKRRGTTWIDWWHSTARVEQLRSDRKLKCFTMRSPLWIWLRIPLRWYRSQGHFHSRKW